MHGTYTANTPCWCMVQTQQTHQCLCMVQTQQTQHAYAWYRHNKHVMLQWGTETANTMNKERKEANNIKNGNRTHTPYMETEQTHYKCVAETWQTIYLNMVKTKQTKLVHGRDICTTSYLHMADIYHYAYTQKTHYTHNWFLLAALCSNNSKVARLICRKSHVANIQVQTGLWMSVHSEGSAHSWVAAAVFLLVKASLKQMW